eukprot:TRINITY_DN66791_c6_g3_i1.p1 TRINITY_DN66791_c6_g3~~TRINITY_DN66791_c6_g3_i1.p1  ORF type:complete len:161 (+),score=5.94 TRINITY_DN66791_c6_g3_i1:195-677(+)
MGEYSWRWIVVELIISRNVECGKKTYKAGIFPVVGSTHVQFVGELLPYKPYNVYTRMAGADERWIYIEQWIEAKNRKTGEFKIRNTAVFKICFLSKKGRIGTAEALEKLEVDPNEIPKLPHYIHPFRESEGHRVEHFTNLSLENREEENKAEATGKQGSK